MQYPNILLRSSLIFEHPAHIFPGNNLAALAEDLQQAVVPAASRRSSGKLPPQQQAVAPAASRQPSSKQSTQQQVADNVQKKIHKIAGYVSFRG